MKMRAETTSADARRRRKLRALLHLCLPAVSGLLLAAAFPPLEWYLLAWIALVPLCLVLADRSWFVETYLGAYLGGVLFQLVHLDWLRTSYGSAGLAGADALYWLLQGIAGGLFWLLLVVMGRRLVRATGWPLVLVLPIAVVSFEFIRRHSWRLLVDETGTPWSQLGYTQADVLPLVQIADLGGVYAVTALVALVNGALWDMASASPFISSLDRGRMALRIRRRRASSSIAAAFALLAATWTYGTWRLHESSSIAGPSVALMPEWTPRIAEEHPLHNDADILLWCEGAAAQAIYDVSQVETANVKTLSENVRRLIENPNPEEAADTIGMFEEQARRYGATLVIGCDRWVAEPEQINKFNSMVCIDPVRGYLGSYDKVFLVPWSEFAPRTLFGTLRGPPHPYTRGGEHPHFEASCRSNGRSFRFTPSICYDNCFAAFYRGAMRNGERAPDFFLHGGSEHADRSQRMARNMLQMTRFRAIESRRAIIRHIFDGFSGLIDANGRCVRLAPQCMIDEPFFIGPIPVDTRRAIYVRFGDWLPWTCVALCAVLLGLRPQSKN